ncbi:MAG TPA: prolipoprotein diacylglyceryl transferase [Tepidisphaeraceae bacterium]|jgi:phosphatidylglycerol:prolipoprotein diacylglycerol transferase
MLPELFHIPFLNIPIYGYGLMLVLGFLGYIAISKFMARRAGINPELFVNAAIWGLIAGIAGARASHVIENWPDYSNGAFVENFLHMINLREGGLTFYGGFLLAAPIVIGYGIYQRVPLRKGMDIVAIGLMIGLGFGRIGCYLNGCCYGEECAWGVRFPYYSDAYREQFQKREIIPQNPALLTPLADSGDAVILKSREEVRREGLTALARQEKANPVQPTQLYSSFNAFLIAALLFFYFWKPHAWGRTFAWMLILDGSSRYILEMIRVEPPLNPHLFGPLSIAQVTAVALVLAGIALWFIFGWYASTSGEQFGDYAAIPGKAPAGVAG